MKRIDPLADSTLLEFARQLIEDEKLDSVSAAQLEAMIKDYRNLSKQKLEAFIKKITPDLRYNIKREYNKYLKGGYKKTNPTLSEYRITDLKPAFRKELDNAVKTSLALIKTQNEQTMLKLEQRFRNWVIIPTKEMRKSLTDKGEMLAGFKESVVAPGEVDKSAEKHLRFVIKDQEHKLVGAMDRITAEENGAIGLIWRTRKDNRVVGNPGGLYPDPGNKKMHGNHFDREGRFYLTRGSWAEKRGYVTPRGVTYIDTIPDGPPGMPIGCRCVGGNVYALNKIPEKYRNCLTAKGKEFLNA